MKIERNNFKQNSNYIPYATHYNYESILTKNGELIFVIKLQNYIDNNYKKTIIDLLKKDSFEPYSVWITTISQKSKINIKEKIKKSEKYDINDDLDRLFLLSKNEDNRLVNEIYLTFIFNDKVNLSKIKNNLSSLLNFNKNKYDKKVNILYSKARIVISDFLYSLKIYSPKLLSIIEEDEVFYCEILGFLARIYSIKDIKNEPESEIKNVIKLRPFDLSKYLIDVNNFDYEIIDQNFIKIKNTKSLEEQYLSVFSIKSNQNKDFNNQISDGLLSSIAPIEFISTEILIKSQKKGILNIKEKSYSEYNKKIIDQSENFDFIENNKIIREFLEYELKSQANSDNINDFILKRNIFTLRAKTLNDIILFSKNFFNKISSFGFFIKKENIFLDQVFWMQLPANFSYFDKVYLSKIDYSLFFNNFNKFYESWTEKFIFKNKTNNLLNKINLNDKKIFFFLDSNDEKIYFLFFISLLRTRCNLRILYINPNNSIISLFKNFFEEDLLLEKLSTNITIDNLEDITLHKQKIKEIFDIISAFLRILFLIKEIVKFEEEEDFILSDNARQKINNFAKSIAFDLASNIKNISLEIIYNIFIKYNIFINKEKIYQVITLFNKRKSYGFYFFEYDQNLNNSKLSFNLSIIFILFKIIYDYLNNNYLLQSNQEKIFIIDIDNDILFSHNVIIEIINEFKIILKNFNIFIVFNINIKYIKNILSIYNKTISESVILSFNSDSEKIIKILNPNFSGNPNFYQNLILVINNMRFSLNEFPIKQIDSILDNFK